MSEKITVPTLGESVTEATVSKWLKSQGDKVIADEPIVELETDKVTQELFAEESGVLQEVFFKEQEEVKIGEIIAKINVDIKKRSEKTEDQKLKDNSFAQKNEKKFYKYLNEKL